MFTFVDKVKGYTALGWFCFKNRIPKEHCKQMFKLYGEIVKLEDEYALRGFFRKLEDSCSSSDTLEAYLYRVADIFFAYHLFDEMWKMGNNKGQWRGARTDLKEMEDRIMNVGYEKGFIPADAGI